MAMWILPTGKLTAFVISILFYFYSGSVCSVSAALSNRSLRIATYNLWNIMFNWDVRKLRIAQMIKELDPDLVALQEVRGDRDGRRNQVDELKQLVPQYQWSVFQSANKVQPMKGTYLSGWEMEGIGLLSKLPLENIHTQNLTYNYGADLNRRLVLHADVTLASATTARIVVVHFSYDKSQQCSNAMDVLQHIQDIEHPVIVAGDFNIYRDQEAAVEMLTSRSPNKLGACKAFNSKRSTYSAVFFDAWTAAHPDDPGLTFSNMPSPGMVSRPDRILVSSSLRGSVTAARLLGHGSIYKERYWNHVLWNRLDNILAATYSYAEGRSCPHDCGPHASCRCGVCISGGDGDSCDLPGCPECSRGVFARLATCVGVFALLLAQLIWSALQVLLAINDPKTRTKPILPIGGPLGKVCVFDAKLYTGLSSRLRQTRRLALCRLWPVFRLPPMFQVIVSVISFSMYFVVALWLFGDLVDEAFAIIPEELNPSDHLMLGVCLQLDEL